MNLKGLGIRDRELLLNSKGAAFWCEELAAKRLVRRGLCHHLRTNKYGGIRLIMAKDLAMLELIKNPLSESRPNLFKRAFNSLFYPARWI